MKKQMHKKYAMMIILLFAFGCAALNTEGLITAKARPFPYPGIYSGHVSNGILSLKLAENGLGLSCFRNKYSGKMFLGDAKYDGQYIYTEDGTWTIDSVTQDIIKMHASIVSIQMHRVENAPTVCKDFFKNLDI